MKQQNAPKYFHIYLDSEETVNLLSDADRGKLLSMLYRFARDGEKPQAENPALAIAFSVFSRQIARDFEEYEKPKTTERLKKQPKQPKKKKNKNKNKMKKKKKKSSTRRLRRSPPPLC